MSKGSQESSGQRPQAKGIYPSTIYADNRLLPNAPGVLRSLFASSPKPVIFASSDISRESSQSLPFTMYASLVHETAETVMLAS